MTKYYPVFKVDQCFEVSGTDFCYIAAESKEDLIKHLEKIYQSENYGRLETKILIKESETRIYPIEHMFSDQPYVILTKVCYYE